MHHNTMQETIMDQPMIVSCLLKRLHVPRITRIDIKQGGGCKASKGEGTVHICTKCARANMRPRPFSASLEEIVMATGAENVTFNSQEIGDVDAISAGILYNSGENV